MTDAMLLDLQNRFSFDVVGWHVVERSEDGTQVRLTPHLLSAAIREALDGLVGVDGWSLTLHPLNETLVSVDLRVGAVHRSIITSTLPIAGLVSTDAGEALTVAETLTNAAWTGALQAFGLQLPFDTLEGGWVDADPESGAPLYPPAHEGRIQVESRFDGVGDAGQTDFVTPQEPGQRVGSSQNRGDEDEAAARPEGHKMIDRIVERLREEGHGAAVARLVTRYGGYGTDADQSRALYAELRSLLRETHNA